MVDLGRVQKELQECNKNMDVSGINMGTLLSLQECNLPRKFGQWSPALTLKTALLSVQALLSAPQPDDPQDAVVAQQYLKDYQTYVGTARYWTENFASSRGLEEKVQKLVEMGFPEASVRSTLAAFGGDENLALEKLCCG
ncbi:Ubiquitin-conjugating enzyme E2 27 [Vitis vinifera]|uniref:Ubiquitin-conjugating enzyme E2 27 n=1 Tax=Vitis vinifera TaxID=29760 RepID=A0A438EXU5_VITVI|nr:Ubiquitin-conjugating enzyme E2 27 [Vitis vinifera]